MGMEKIRWYKYQLWTVWDALLLVKTRSNSLIIGISHNLPSDECVVKWSYWEVDWELLTVVPPRLTHAASCMDNKQTLGVLNGDQQCVSEDVMGM